MNQIANLKQLIRNDLSILEEYDGIETMTKEEKEQRREDLKTLRMHRQMLNDEIKKYICDIMDRAYFDYQGEIYDKDYNCIEYIPGLVYLVTDDCDMEDVDIEDLNDFIQNDLYQYAYDSVPADKKDQLPDVMKVYFQFVKAELLDYCM